MTAQIYHLRREGSLSTDDKRLIALAELKDLYSRFAIFVALYEAREVLRDIAELEGRK